MKYKACIFDFDLTLADSSKGILICFKHTLNRFGYKIPDDKTIYNTIGMTLVDALDLLSGIPNNPQREQMRVEYVKKADEEMVKNTLFYEGVIASLEKLQSQGIKVGICSSKFRYRIVDSFLVQAGKLPVDLIIGMEDIEKAKPDPQGLLKCIEAFEISRNEVLYVGDNIIDAKCAENANVNFGAVLTGSTTKDEFLKHPCVGIAENMPELLKNINLL
ncbi:MAG: HAD-IA family hydrolase [Ruminococcus sp.]|nr:HAD-IA family hydrolase [Ruminococcus sp.]